MDHDDTLTAVGQSAAGMIGDPGKWIHRRVESITFPSPDDIVIRRNVSIDCSIPLSLRPALAVAPEPAVDGEGEEDYRACVTEDVNYYLPVTLLRKWPPVPNLDLRTSGGDSIPLLTRRQNGLIDGALLVEMAERILRRAGEISATDRLNSDVREVVESIATSGPRDALAAFKELGLSWSWVDDDVDRQRGLIVGNERWLQVAGGLCQHTILWLRVAGHPRSRHILKIAYDARVTELDQLRLWHPASFAWESLNVQLDVPHLGDAASHHLQFHVPPPIRIASAYPKLDPKLGEARSDRDADRTRMAALSKGQRAHLYVTGHREPTELQLQLELLLGKAGAIRGAAVSAALIALLLGAYAVNLDEATSTGGAALGLLFLVPGLLAYLVVRPGQHAAPETLFRGVRLLVLLVGALPLLGALGILIAGGGYTDALGLWFYLLTIAAGGLTALLAASAFLPRQADVPPDPELEAVNPRTVDAQDATARLRQLISDAGDSDESLKELREFIENHAKLSVADRSLLASDLAAATAGSEETDAPEAPSDSSAGD